MVYSYERETLRKKFRSFIGINQIDSLKEYLSDFLKKYGVVNPTEADIIDFGIDKLFLNCYHFAKNFYHEHEVHSESDGRLEAYFYTVSKGGKKRQYITQQPKMSIKNHVVLNWFIDQFEKQFIKYAKDVSSTYKNITSFLDDVNRIIEKAPEKARVGSDEEVVKLLAVIRWYKYVVNNMTVLYTKNEYNKYIKKEIQEIGGVLSRENVIKEINEYVLQQQDSRLKYIHCHLNKLEVQCADVLTEYAYCKTLVESKYNRHYNHQLLVTEREIQAILNSRRDNPGNQAINFKDDCRKKAFNIRNCVRYIEGVRQKCIIRENDLSYLIANKIAGISKEIVNISNENKGILSNSIRSGKMSERIGWFSVALGSLSVALALFNNDHIILFCEEVNSIVSIVAFVAFFYFFIKGLCVRVKGVE